MKTLEMNYGSSVTFDGANGTSSPIGRSTQTARCVLWAAVTLMPLVSACSKRASSVHPASMSSSQSQRQPTTTAGSEDREWYRTAKYLYEGERCSLVPRDSAKAIGFECGVIELVLQPGLSVQDAQSIITDLSASLEKALVGPRTSAFIRVPARRERESIIRAYADPKVHHAGLDLHRRGVI